MELQEADLLLLPFLAALEADAFPLDEMADEATIASRIRNASKYFQVVLNANVNADSDAIVSATTPLIGFINGTCVEDPVITEESMTEHVPGGRYLIIHSVTIHSTFHRKGLGSRMLKEYVAKIAFSCPEIDCLLLLCKAHLIKFYVDCGFILTQLSPVVHGQESWFEMKLDLVEMRRLDQYVVDAFSAGAFTGNPAAVVLLSTTNSRDEKWMQCMAAENNLAETSFLSPIPDTVDGFHLRWFTPLKEVDLCGHATLAAAHILYETKKVRETCPILFHTVSSGVLTATKKSDGTIQLDFPATPVRANAFTPSQIAIITKAFSISSADIKFTGQSMYDTFIEVTPDAFASIGEDVIFEELKTFGGRGVVLTCIGGGGGGGGGGMRDTMDFQSRCFFPL